MAPSPQHDSEPKAPDKSAGGTSQASVEIRNPPAPTSPAAQLTEGKHVDGLDDGQLRALLDEAITYKCPKDREGKSLLFKELLEEAEQVEEEADGRSRRALGVRVGEARRRGRRGERPLPHSSSLQDLLGAALADVAPQRRRHAPVSARTGHGGSLPSGVDRSFLLGEEPVRGGADYIATVRCVNPPPLTERRVSVSDAHNSGTEMEIINRSKIPCSSVTYTSRATLDINSGSSRAAGAHTTTTCSNQVDSGITFGCITTPAVVTSCNTTSSAPAPCASVDSKPRSVITTSINGLASLSRNYGAAGSSSADDFKKSLDEHGNALQTFHSPLSGSSQHKKRTKKKSSKNETVAMSEQIDGYQGNKELSEVLRFIESDAEHGRTHKHKHHHDDDKGKKRSTERRTKDKADKMQRANSMEELSLTKLEDLTHDKSKGDLSLRKNKKERVSDGGDTRKSDRRSWGDETRTPYYHSNSEEPTAATIQPALPARDKKNKSKQNKSAEWPQVANDPLAVEAPVETLEFQTVTKKKRTRKRHSPHESVRGGGGTAGSDIYRKMRAPTSPDRRRKSAPPSDKSNDSNDDLDSVHSLPAEPTAERCTVRPGSASSGGTPQASYADIARTRHNIPDLIESCNFYTDLTSPERPEEKPQRKKEPVCRSDSAPVETRRTPPKTTDDTPVGPTYDTENYPALEARAHRTLPRTKQDSKPPAVLTKQIERRKVLSEPAVVEKLADSTPAFEEKTLEATSEPPPDVVLAPDRRPAVILLDEESRPREMEGITFGFDINEQLLNGDHRDAPTLLAPFPSSDEFPAINEKRTRVRCDLVRDALAAGAVSVRAGRAALRYLPPAPLSTTHTTNLHKLANYVGSAWEDIMKCPGGKVRYFSQ